MGLLIISSFASARLILSSVKSFKLSATSVSPTLGWKNIGASKIDRIESTPSIFLRSFSRFAILFNE